MKFAKAVTSTKTMSIILACMTILFGLFIIYQLGKVGKEGAALNKALENVKTKSVAFAKTTVAKTSPPPPKKVNAAKAPTTLQKPTAKAPAKPK